MNPVILFIVIAQVLLSTLRFTEGQVPMELNPSYHRISYRVGPDGRTDMGGHGRELDQFFNGLGSGGRRAGFRNSGRRRRPMRRWSYYRFF